MTAEAGVYDFEASRTGQIGHSNDSAMKPLYFDGCFGWFHPAAGKRAVLLCNALGHEALWTHAGMARLAVTLADVGFPVLRFDYPGTGDGADLPQAKDHAASWLASVGAAADLLATQTGATELVLVGVRGGASLAVEAVGRRPMALPVVGAVLLAPVPAGRMLVREMHMLYQTWRALAGSAVQAAEKESDGGDDLHLLGMRFNQATLATLRAVDLAKARQPPASRILLAGNDSQVEGLRRHYAGLGARAEARAFPEALQWLQDPLYSKPPEQMIGAVLDWIARLPAASADTGHAPRAVPACHGRLRGEGWIETPVRFGQNLFGLLCEPAKPQATSRALLINNAGATHHVGAGRGGVLLARHLAKQGLASLRIDVRGVGDTAADAAAPAGVPADPDGYLDAIAAVDWLQAHGWREVVPFGVSYGASVSLHVAATHPAVVGAVMVNLSSLMRREGFQRPRWLVHGRSTAGAGAGNPLLTAEAVLPEPSVAEQAEVQAMMDRLAQRDVVLRLLFGPDDPGPFELARFFGKRFERLATYPQVHIEVLPSLDHGMLHPPGRTQVFYLISRWLAGPLHAVAPASWRSTGGGAAPAMLFGLADA